MGHDIEQKQVKNLFFAQGTDKSFLCQSLERWIKNNNVFKHKEVDFNPNLKVGLYHDEGISSKWWRNDILDRQMEVHCVVVMALSCEEIIIDYIQISVHILFRGEPPQPGAVWGPQPPGVGDSGWVSGAGEAAPPQHSVLRTSPPLQALAPHVCLMYDHTHTDDCGDVMLCAMLCTCVALGSYLKSSFFYIWLHYHNIYPLLEWPLLCCTSRVL